MESKELKAIVKELEHYSGLVKAEELTRAADLLYRAERIFVAGAGRTGFASRGFANRLMHLGKTAYFVGETTTPAIMREDTLIIGSGSGTTTSLTGIAQRARDVGACLITLTVYPEHTIGRLCDAVITLPGVSPKKQEEENDTAVSIPPMGSLFEQLCWLTYDTLVLLLMKKMEVTGDEMYLRHANLE